MPNIDTVIAAAVFMSVVIGLVRGFIKEAISVAALLIAIWGALHLGPGVGDISENWIKSPDLQMWFGRVLVFAVILLLGGLLGWGVARLVRLSVLSGMDRLAGAFFGAGRGILLAALFVIGGQYAGFDDNDWWLESRLIPRLQVVADWILVMAPQGLELLVPEPSLDALEVELPATALEERA
jgi:membrane protein required for colicin V production